MIKFRLIFEGEAEDELFDTYDEAYEAGVYDSSCASLGAEIFHESNPGDYDYDEDDEYDFEIEEVEVDD